MARRMLIVLSVALMLSSGLVVPVQAAPSPEESKWVVVSKLRSIDVALDNSYSGQYGLYYELYYLTLYARWVDFLNDFDGVHGINFSETEKESYNQELLLKFQRFNTRFSSESEDYVSLELPIYDSTEDIRVALEESIQRIIPQYIEGRLESFHEELEQALQVDITRYNTIIAENRNSIRYMYRILRALVYESEEMVRTLPDGASLSVISSSLALELMNNEKYLDILERARQIDQQEVADMDHVSLTSSDEYLEILAYVERIEDTDGVGVDAWRPSPGRYSLGFELQPVYMRMFSAGAVYRPLVSYVGDKEYIEALKSLSGDQADEVIKLFNEIKDYKKPLYTIYDGSRWFESSELLKWLSGRAEGVEDVPGSFPTYVGKAKLLTLQNVIDNIQNNVLFGLVMETGELRQSDTDANVYFYYNSRLKETTLSDGTVIRSSGNDIVGSADEEKTSTTWTSTVFESGGKSSDKVSYFAASTTLAMMKNILTDSERILNSLGDLNQQYLYMNVFGDIVTKDNLVVLPGVANPKFYNPETGYVPYTVAFMKHYPAIYTTGNTLKLGTSEDQGKYLFLSDDPDTGSRVIFLRIKGENDLATTEPYLASWVDMRLAESVGTQVSALNRTEVTGALSGFWNNFKYNWSRDWNPEYHSMFSPTIVEKYPLVSSYGVDVFNYNPEEDLDYEVAKYLARNMYLSFKTAEGQVLPNFNDKIDQDYLFRNVVLEALNGTVYATGYSKSLTETFENVSESTHSFFKGWMVSITKEIVSSFGGITGVLGMKDSYQDTIFGKFLYFTDKYLYFILIGMFLVFVIKFMRNRASLTYTLVSSLLCLVVVFVSLKVFPLYFPKIYNVVVNNFNTRLSYDIIASKAEKYWETYGRSGQTDEEGKFLINTSSINLYKLDDQSLRLLEDRYKISPEDIGAGKVYLVDNNVGLYLEANTLKQNLDLLFYTNPIFGQYKDTPSGTVYQISAEKTNSSVVEYYMPYYQIQDGFVDTLNKLLEVYVIPRYSVQYANGLYKDSFVVYNYLNSAPFLTPGQYTDSDESMTPEIVNALYYHFDNEEYNASSRDFLNLHRMLSNPTIAMQESLWWRSLVQNGFFELDEDGNLPSKYWNLIESVNLNTKKFLIELKPQAGLISDENLIKITSLYATMLFNEKISNYGNWVYPTVVNYQEFNLHDALLGVVSSSYGRYTLLNRDLVDYVADNSGAFSVILLMLDVLFGGLVSLVIQFAIPVFYISFLVLLLIRFFMGASLKGLVSGYSKVFVLIFLCLTVSVLSLHLVSNWSIPYALGFLLLVNLLILYFMFHIVSSVLFNFTEMGNTRLTEKISSFMSKTRLNQAIDSLKVTTTNLLNNRPNMSLEGLKESRYRYEADIDAEIASSVTDLTYLERMLKTRKKKNNKSSRYVFDDDEELRNELDERRDRNI